MDDQAKIACCKTCLLAEAMKDCEKCPFRIGLENTKQILIYATGKTPIIKK